MISLGTAIAATMPLLPDYVDKDSIGLANAYVQVIASSALIFSSTVLVPMSVHVPLLVEEFVHFGIGVAMSTAAIFMIWGIKDIIEDTGEEQIEFQTSA